VTSGSPVTRSAALAPNRRPADGVRGLRHWLVTERAAVIAHLLSLLVTLAVLLYYGSHQWFFTDEWEFITRNLPGQGRLGLFVPHNEHWSTIPILIYRVLFAAVGLHSYIPYILVLILLHLAAAHLAWRLAMRAGARAWVATSVAAIFLMLGVGWEQMVSAFQVGFSLSLVCGLAWLLINDHDGPAAFRVSGGWALGLAASMSSGIGIAMIGAVAVAALARRGPRDGVAVVSIPVLANLAWYAVVHPLATSPSTGHQLTMLPQFVWRGLSATADGALGVPVVGGVLLVGLTAWLVTRGRYVSSLAIGAGSGALFLFILVGYGRISLGVDQAAAPRYLYLAAALLACPAALALTATSRRWPRSEALVVATLALSTLHGAYVLRVNVRVQLVARVRDRAIVMAAARVVTSGATLLGLHPDPFYGPDIDVADLRTLVRTGELRITDPVNPSATLTVESRLEMSSGSSRALNGPPPVMTVTDANTGAQASCDVAPSPGRPTASVKVTFAAPSAFAMTSVRAETVTAVLTSTVTGSAAAPPITYELQPATATWIAVSAPNAVLTIDVAGATTFAGSVGC
jgi:hypothetical protein